MIKYDCNGINCVKQERETVTRLKTNDGLSFVSTPGSLAHFSVQLQEQVCGLG